MTATRTPTDQDAAFLAAICQDPEDVVSRLVYADWLEDQGEVNRPEIIRFQCKLAHPEMAVCTCFASRWPGNTYECERCVLRRRERGLLQQTACWSRWLHDAFDSLSHDVGVAFRGNHTKAHYEFAVSLYDNRKGEMGHFDCTFRRGFVEHISCPMLAWWRHGRQIVRQCPVTAVEITDRRPREDLENSVKGFFNVLGDMLTASMDRDTIPYEIWKWMPNLVEPRDPEQATVNLNAACLKWARETSP